MIEKVIAASNNAVMIRCHFSAAVSERIKRSPMALIA
jgi:hypothetical protein